MNDLVLESAPAEGVRLLRLNRPEARNALNLALRQALAARIEALAEDPDVRAVVLTGNEKIFAAGADLKVLVEATPLEVMESGLHKMWRAIAQFPKPLIAAVQGVALGAGCELAMSADLIVAGEGARFGQPEIKVGIMPGAGGVQRLVRLVGRTKALRLLLTGEPIDGRTAYDWGLASEVVADAEVVDRAVAYAVTIAALPALAARQIKESVQLGEDLPLEAALALERKAFLLTFAAPDQREGMTAFLEKRSPVFNRPPE